MLDLSAAEGTPLAGTVTLDALTADGVVLAKEITLDSENAQEFTVNVSSKRPYIYVAPADGYYIYTVQGKEEGQMTLLNSASTALENNTFYIVAEPLEGYVDMKFNVTGTKSLRLSANTSITNNWDNPTPSFSIKEGEQTISYIPELHLPLTLRALENFTTFEGYLDGVKLTADENGALSITPPDTSKVSSVTVFADGTTRGVTGTVKLTCAEGLSAETYYSEARHATTLDASGKTLLKGTEFVVKPSDASCAVTLNGEAASLNADGEFVFAVEEGANDVAISMPAKVLAPNSTDPADGETVKTLAQVTVNFPCIGDENMLTFLDPENALAQITITGENGEVIKALDFGDIEYEYMTDSYNYSFVFEELTEAGVYTFHMPEGIMNEVGIDYSSWDYVMVENGYVNSEVTTEFTIDPAMATPINVHTFIPAAGSKVDNISIIWMSFDKFNASDYMLNLNDDMTTISNGTTSYPCMVVPAEYLEDIEMPEAEGKLFAFIPCTEDYDMMTITEDGTWTLEIPAEMFVNYKDYTTNDATSVSYVIANSSYILTPADGATTGRISKITLAFPGVEEAEYTDKEITLEGNGFKSSTTGVQFAAYSENHNTFTIQFSSTPIEGGEYTLTIPEGAFTLDGAASEAITATYTYEPEWRLIPAPGSTVESFDNIIIEFPNASEVAFTGSQFSILLTNGGSYAATGFTCTEVEGASCPTFRIAINPESQMPAVKSVQNFIIEEGAFTIDGIPSDEIRCTYTYDRAISVQYQISPDTSRLVYDEYGAMWAFIFDESASVRANDTDLIRVTVDDQTLSYGPDFIAMAEANTYMMMISNTDMLTDGAKLSVVLEEGALTLSGEPSSRIEASWILTQTKEHAFEITPDATGTINQLGKITIGFPDAETGEIYLPSGAMLRNNSYSYSQTAEITAAEGDYPMFDMTFATAPTQADSYTLNIHRGTFTLDEVQESPEITLVYNFDPTGIEMVTITTDGPVNVVTIDGRIILKDADADALLTLPAGIYIINGQKKVVK